MRHAVLMNKLARKVLRMLSNIVVGQELIHAIMILLSLHLYHKVTMARVDIFWVENTAIGFEPTFSFMPPILIKLIKVISPVKLKLIQSFIPSKYFNEVVSDKPWHIFGIKSVTPCVIYRCPEVHPQGLGFVYILDSIMT